MNRPLGMELGFSRTDSLESTDSRNFTDAAATALTGNVTRGVKDVMSKVLSPKMSSTATPQMSFIPMNSEETARQLLAPMPIELFVLLLHQGWPADHLRRLLVERIELSYKGKVVQVLSNRLQEGTIESFKDFLWCCADARRRQKVNDLRIVADERFVQVSPTVPTVPLSASNTRIAPAIHQ